MHRRQRLCATYEARKLLFDMNADRTCLLGFHNQNELDQLF